MSRNRPYIVTLLGDYNILGAILLILTYTPILNRYGVTVQIPDYLVLPMVSQDVAKGYIIIITLIISYGYLKLKKWGYWLLVGENLLYIAGWMVTYLNNKGGNNIRYPISTTLIELIFIVPTIKYFYKKEEDKKI